MPHHREALITTALAEIEGGAAVKPTARKYGLPRSTLQGRLRGALPHPDAHQRALRLSRTQETFLAQWCLDEEASAGRAPTRRQVCQMAQAILAEGGEDRPLGVNWIERFLERNPRLKSERRNQILQEDPEAVAEPEAAAPGTPPRDPEPPELAAWRTPRKAQDLRQYEEALQGGGDSAYRRDVRVLFKKLRRALDTLNAENALLRSQLARKDVELEALQATYSQEGRNSLE